MQIIIPIGLTGTIVPPFNGTFKVDGRAHHEGAVTFSGKQNVTFEEESWFECGWT
jgi:hypothetical protein